MPQLRRRGTAIDLILVTRPTDIRGALDLLADRHHLTPNRTAPDRPAARPDPEGLARYVEDCARRLWRPEGRRVLDWLTGRGLDPDVLRANQTGADPGPRHQPRPDGMPRASGAVLAALDPHGTPLYAQLRLLNPRSGQPRYLNPAAGLAPNPRITHIRPTVERRPEILVTEGTIDALTAASAGYRAAAILGAGYPDDAIAAHLARLPGPLVLAFDPDAAGALATHRLAALLAAHHRPAARLPTGHGDLNDRRLAAADWPEALDALVDTAVPASGRAQQAPRHPGLGMA